MYVSIWLGMIWSLFRTSILRVPRPVPQQEKILGNAEIQHRLLESIPMLQALPGFAEVKGRRLSDEEVGE